MFDSDALRQIFSIPVAAWTTTAIIALLVIRMWNGAPKWFDRWLEWKKAVAAERQAVFNRLSSENQRLDGRVVALEEQRDVQERENQSCRDDLADAKGRIATLEGYNIGRGKASQEAATVVAADRLENHKDAPKSDEKFGENGK